MSGNRFNLDKVYNVFGGSMLEIISYSIDKVYLKHSFTES